MRLIDAEQAANKLGRTAGILQDMGYQREAGAMIAASVVILDEEYVPNVDAAPVKHGHWVKNQRGDYCDVCEHCGYGFPNKGIAWMDCNRVSDEREVAVNIADVRHYCPNCGVKMYEEDGEK